MKKYRSERKGRRSFDTAVEYARVIAIANEKTRTAKTAVRATCSSIGHFGISASPTIRVGGWAGIVRRSTDRPLGVIGASFTLPTSSCPLDPGPSSGRLTHPAFTGLKCMAERAGVSGEERSP